MAKRQNSRGSKPAPGPQEQGPNWRILLGLGVLAAAFAVAASLLFSLRKAQAPTVVAGTPVTLARAVDGIPCNDEVVTYHEHAHLAILDRGKAVTVPAQIGIVDDTCLYWLHTHDDSGEIHMEAPAFKRFTLGQFFDVWGQLLSRHNVAGHRVMPGTSMRVYVNGRRFQGNPRSIPLLRHTQVGIEIGPPYARPRPFDFGGE